MVLWTRSTFPFDWGRPALVNRWTIPSPCKVSPNSLARNSFPLSVDTCFGVHPQPVRSAATWWASLDVTAGSGFHEVPNQFGPHPRRCNVDRGVLPDLTFMRLVFAQPGFFERTHVETVHLDQVA